MSELRVALIGCGAIGRTIARAIAKGELKISLGLVYDRTAKRAEEIAESVPGTKVAKGIDEILRSDVKLVVEAASIDAAREFGMALVKSEKDLMIMSAGALADDKFLDDLLRTAEKKGTKIYVPSGAVGCLDALKSASIAKLREVQLVTTKPPASLGVAAKSRKKVFEGSAREAIKRFPANINVSVALALAGLGLDDTKVTIVADPRSKRNVHEIRIAGDFGELRARVANVPAPDNPKTSHLAALSAIAMLKRIASPLEVGN